MVDVDKHKKLEQHLYIFCSQTVGIQLLQDSFKERLCAFYCSLRKGV
jgi:hypothetical protein